MDIAVDKAATGIPALSATAAAPCLPGTGPNRPGLVRRIRLFTAFARLGMVEYLRSAMMILTNITFPWFALLMLIPFAVGEGMESKTEIRVARVAEGPVDAAEEQFRGALREVLWLKTRRLEEEKARHQMDSSIHDGLLTSTPAPDGAAPGTPPVLEIQVREPDNPLWPVLAARLAAPAPAAQEERPVVLAPVALRETGPNPGAYAGFFAVLLGFSMMGVAIQVLTDRTDSWANFLRVAPLSPALALSGLAGGRLLITALTFIYQWFVIDWTIGWPAGMSVGLVVAAMTLGTLLIMLLGTAYALLVPAYHGAKDTAPQAMWFLVLALPLFWSPGEMAWAQALALANPLMPLLDLLRAGFGTEPMLVGAPVAIGLAGAWIAAGAAAVAWAGPRAFRPARSS